MKCEHCDRKALTKGLCNAHYLRKRNNTRMDTPIHLRGGFCIVCGEPNYGLGACRRHYHKVRGWLIKTRLVEHLGGKCKICDGVFPVAAFDFHHRNPSEKSFAIGNEYNNRGYEEILTEVNKCDLLCANCHRIHHTEGVPCQVLTMQFKLF